VKAIDTIAKGPNLSKRLDQSLTAPCTIAAMPTCSTIEHDEEEPEPLTAGCFDQTTPSLSTELREDGWRFGADRPPFQVLGRHLRSAVWSG
jgi:hypothetical protein